MATERRDFLARRQSAAADLAPQHPGGPKANSVQVNSGWTYVQGGESLHRGHVPGGVVPYSGSEGQNPRLPWPPLHSMPGEENRTSTSSMFTLSLAMGEMEPERRSEMLAKAYTQKVKSLAPERSCIYHLSTCAYIYIYIYIYIQRHMHMSTWSTCAHKCIQAGTRTDAHKTHRGRRRASTPVRRHAREFHGSAGETLS